VSRHGVAVSLPSTSFDVGISDNLSVGTYLLSLLPNVGGDPALALKARYRLHSDGRATAVLDLLAGGGGDRQNRAWVALVGMNASYQISRRDLVTVAFLGGRVSASDPEFALDLTGALLGLSYQATFARWFAVQLTAVNLPLVAGVAETDSELISLQLNNDVSALFARSFVRALLVFRLGGWVLEGGAIAGAVIPNNALPWLNVSKIW
jgi:hypothetical protein